MREVQLTRESRGPSTQQENRSTEPGRGIPAPTQVPAGEGKPRILSTCQPSRLWGRGRRAALYIRVPGRPAGASGAWEREAIEGPGPRRSGSSAEAERGREGAGGDRDQTAPSTFSPTPSGIHGRPGTGGFTRTHWDPLPLARSTWGGPAGPAPRRTTFPKGRFQPSPPPRGRSGPLRGLPTPSAPRPPRSARDRSPLPTYSAGLARVRPLHWR